MPQPLAPAERRAPARACRSCVHCSSSGTMVCRESPAGRRASPPTERSGTTARSRRRPARSAAALSGHARQREIADRDHVRAGVVRPRVAAAVAEGVELLDIADVERGLRRRPRRAGRSRRCGAPADRTGRTAGRRGCRSCAIGGDQDARLVASTATMAAVSPTSIGVRMRSAIVARSMRRSWIIPDRAGRVRPRSAGMPGPMRFDRGDHAAVAAEDAVGMADQHGVGHGGRRGSREWRARSSPRRGRD